MRRRLINLFAKGVTLQQGPITAPERVCLWEPGVIRGDFGENIWDALAAAEVMRNYFARGNPIPIDIEHNSNPKANPKLDLSNPQKGGGYATIEVDLRGALWATGIRWSAYAREEIESGSRCAVSPDWHFDPETKRPIRLNKISLVQNPGTFGIGLMASASGAPQEKTMESIMMLKAALQAALATKDPEAMAAALQAILAELDKGGGGGAADVTDPALEMAAGDPNAITDIKKACASALAMLDGIGIRGASARASAGQPSGKVLSESEIRSIVRSETAAAHRDVNAIEGLIASAKTSPGYTEGLGSQLRGLPVQTVRQLVANLAPATAAASGSNATAGAAAGATATKTGPMPGARAEKPATSATDQASIDLINGASPSIETALASAEKAAKDGAAEGVGVFSALPQILGSRKPSGAA